MIPLTTIMVYIFAMSGGGTAVVLAVAVAVCPTLIHLCHCTASGQPAFGNS